MLTLVETPMMARLEAVIRDHGPMTMAEFMAMALYDPEYGYYMCRDPIGMRGDFITAPEISQIFGELIGLWALETWRQQALDGPIHLVEMGPGHGTLAHDMMRTLARFTPDTDLNLDLVEISPALTRLQHERLKRWGDRIHWHERLSEIPDGPAIIIANELLDALPVRQFVRTDAGWREIMLDCNQDGRPAFTEGPVTHAVPDWARDLPIGSIVEDCPALPELLHEIARRLQKSGGAALLIDYGYDSNDHPRDANWVSTVQAMSRHGYVGLLERPGQCDLTAHVDFGAILRLARVAGLRVDGPIPQGRFLQSLGGDVRCQQLMSQNPEQAHDILTRYRRLITPAEMGVLFKVMILTPGEKT